MATKAQAQEFARVWAEADKAGKAAVEGLNVVPMVVQQRANPFDDSSPVVKSYYVADGVCGFAYVQFKGNTAFGRWAKANVERVRPDSYLGGLCFSVWDYGQSLQKKETYANAFAAFLKANGVPDAWSHSRMD